jgi:glutaredoxin
MSGRVLVYVTQGCPHSSRLIQILRDQKVTHDQVDLTQYPLGIDTLSLLAKDKSVPQVFVNGHYMGVRIQLFTIVVLTVVLFCFVKLRLNYTDWPNCCTRTTAHCGHK